VSTARRLDHLENSLTPLEAVLLWLAEAHAHPSVNAYVLTLQDQPLAAYPLVWLPDLVEPGVRAARKGEPRSDVDHAVFEAKRDLAFLYELAMECNLVWFERERTVTLGYMLVVEQLSRLLEWEPRIAKVRKGKDWDTYLRLAAAFVDHADRFQREVLVVDAAIRAVGVKYFGGAAVLWPETAAAIARLLQDYAFVGEFYNDQVAEAPPLRKLPRYRASTAEALRGTSDGAVAVMTAYLVDRAKAETLRLVGEDNQACDLMAKYVG